MYYSDEVVEEVRSRNDIVDVISGYVKLQRKGSSYFGLCPFHNEKSPSFSVSPGKQMYYCFGCGAGGNVFTFIMEYENYSFPEALKMLADRAGITLPEQDYSEEAKQKRDLKSAVLEINKIAAKYYYYTLLSPQGERGMHYLRDRHLSDETMQKFTEEMQYAQPRGPHAQWPEISDALSLAVNESITGTSTPADAAAKAQSTIDGILAE